MRMFFLGVVSIAVVGSTASAQRAVRQASAADSVMIRNNIYRELFAGIALTDEQRVMAQQTIATEERAQWKIPPYTTCAARQQRVVLIAQRDSTLLAMLTNAADSAKFKEHAAAFIMGPCPFSKD